MSEKSDKNEKISENKTNFESKQTKPTKSDSNYKRFDNNFDSNKSKTNEVKGYNDSKGYKDHHYYRKQHNDYYDYNSNRFKHNDRNRRPETSYKYGNKSSDYDRSHRRHEINDRSNHLNKRSNHSNRCENKPTFDSNDSNCGKSEDKECSEDNNNLQLVLDEITALKSIFGENLLTIDEKQLKGRFLAEPVLNTNGFVITYDTNNTNHRYSHRHDSRERLKSKDNNEICDQNKTQVFSVQHLPPIELYFELPKAYPTASNPMFLLSCKWLTITQLGKICEELERLWRESQMEVLFIWFSFLQNEVLEFLEISHQLDITSLIRNDPKWVTESKMKSNSCQTNSSSTFSKSLSGVSSCVVQFKPCKNRGFGRYDRRAACDRIGKELVNQLKSYNDYKTKETFNKSYILCDICFSQHLGEDCVVFACNHMNCKTCVKDYFTTLVNEGTVNQIKCPETACETSAPPDLVRQLLSEELFKKYERLMLDAVIGSMSDAYYCPRKACGHLVIAESDSSLAHCSSCGYAFCKNCKFSYHGFDPCNMFRDSQQRKVILEKYKDGNATERVELEKLYGKKQLVSALEEAASEKWLEDMSKRCPHCKAFIEKSDGCNKMSCWRCNTFFCWICLSQLQVTQPYSHYNDPNSKCFNQLFRGVNFDEDMWPEWDDEN